MCVMREAFQCEYILFTLCIHFTHLGVGVGQGSGAGVV